MAESWESFPSANPASPPSQAPAAESWQGFQAVPPPPGWVINNPGAGANDPVAEMKALGYEGARGASFGLINKIAPESVTKNAEAFEAQNPIKSEVARIAGSLIPGAVTPYALPLAGLKAGATLPAAIGANTLVGAGAGALSGYGESADNPIRDTALGAVTGAGLGAVGPVVGESARPLLQGLLMKVSPTSAEAASLRAIRQRIMQDTAAGGPSIADMRAQLQASQDKPLGLVDVGGSNLQGLAGAVSRVPGKSKETASGFFTDRDVSATPRLLNDIENHVSNGGDAYTAVQALANQRAKAAQPLYEEAFNRNNIVASDRIREFADDPIMQRGLATGLKIQRLEALAQGKPFNPNDYRITYDDAGEPKFEATPNLRTHDAAKRGLDSMLSDDPSMRDPVTGRMTQMGRAVNQVRAAYINELDNLTGGPNGAYAQAREAWGGPSRMIDAMKLGQNFKSMSPPEIASELQGLSAGERQAALVGVADTLRKDVLSAALSGDESKRVINNVFRQDQLRPFFQDDDTYRKFLNGVLAERRMFETQTKVTRGSQTAERLAEDSEGGKGLLPSLAQLGTGAAAFIHGEPLAGAGMATRGLLGAIQHLRQPNPRVAEGIAGYLFNPDLAANQTALSGIAGAMPRRPKIPFLTPGISEALSGLPADFLGRGQATQP